VVTAAASRVAEDSHTAADADAAETWLAPLAAPLAHCATDLRVSQLRVAAAEALAAAADALRKREGSSTRAACVKQLEAMRDDDRAPDVRGAAGRALAPRGE
jgi:hypothetical protein